MKKIITAISMSVLLAACAGDMNESVSGNSSGNSSGSSASSGSSMSSSSQSGKSFTAADERNFIANIGDRVFFGYDRATLTPTSLATLKAQAAWFQWGL